MSPKIEPHGNLMVVVKLPVSLFEKELNLADFRAGMHDAQIGAAVLQPDNQAYVAGHCYQKQIESPKHGRPFVIAIEDKNLKRAIEEIVHRMIMN